MRGMSDDYEADEKELNSLMATAGALSIGNGAMLYSPALAGMLDPLPGHNDPPAMPVTPRNAIGRNNPCPCGSGKKYKRCCKLTPNPEQE